jgi:pyruvate dehydrogenase E2 component (dihydrolipoyllysine-residue acetyltransferase)
VISEVRMPKLGMAMKKGIVTTWRVAEGEEVQEGTELLEIETEKVRATVPASASGVLGRIVAGPGTQLPVGALLALIGEPGDVFPPKEDLAAGTPAMTRPAAVGSTGSGGAPVSPAARRRAKELGLDVTLVPPSAPGKRVTSDDVDAYVVAQGAAPAREADLPEAARVIPLTSIRATVAERLTQSLREMAQVTISREAEVSSLVRRRADLAAGFEAATGVRLTYTDLLVEALAALLPEHPLLNATLTERGIEVSKTVHIGVAVALDDGLVVPVIHDAGARSLGDIARSRAELAERAKAGTLGLDEVEGGTFTLSNLGSYGADTFTPIVNPPQCAILGTGRITQKPAVVDGEVVVRPMMWLSLTFDHRIVDGAPAAQFLEALESRLE